MKAAQGTIKSMNFSTSTGLFETQILVDPTITAPTLIHTNVLSDSAVAWYPQGIDLEVSPLTIQFKIWLEGNNLYVLAEDNFEEQIVTIKIWPKTTELI